MATAVDDQRVDVVVGTRLEKRNDRAVAVPGEDDLSVRRAERAPAQRLDDLVSGADIAVEGDERARRVP